MYRRRDCKNDLDIEESKPFLGTFRFLLGGSTIVQLPLTRKRNSVPFLEVSHRIQICFLDFFYTLKRSRAGAFLI